MNRNERAKAENQVRRLRRAKDRLEHQINKCGDFFAPLTEAQTGAQTASALVTQTALQLIDAEELLDLRQTELKLAQIKLEDQTKLVKQLNQQLKDNMASDKVAAVRVIEAREHSDKTAKRVVTYREQVEALEAEIAPLESEIAKSIAAYGTHEQARLEAKARAAETQKLGAQQVTPAKAGPREHRPRAFLPWGKK